MCQLNISLYCVLQNIYRQSEPPATVTSGDDVVVSLEQQANKFLDFDEADNGFRGFNTNPLSPSTVMPLQVSN